MVRRREENWREEVEILALIAMYAFIRNQIHSSICFRLRQY